MTAPILTQSELKSLFHYDPLTGIFIRIFVPSRCPCKVGDIVGWVNSEGYLNTSIKGKTYNMHRLAWLYVHGKFPDDQLDHINGIKDDNRIVNLREVTQTENSKNTKIPCNNKSGIMGIYWNKNHKKWHARIEISGKRTWLGAFTNKEDAISARKLAEIEHGYHENHGRD